MLPSRDYPVLRECHQTKSSACSLALPTKDAPDSLCRCLQPSDRDAAVVLFLCHHLLARACYCPIHWRTLASERIHAHNTEPSTFAEDAYATPNSKCRLPCVKTRLGAEQRTSVYILVYKRKTNFSCKAPEPSVATTFKNMQRRIIYFFFSTFLPRVLQFQCREESFCRFSNPVSLFQLPLDTLGEMQKTILFFCFLLHETRNCFWIFFKSNCGTRCALNLWNETLRDSPILATITRQLR